MAHFHLLKELRENYPSTTAATHSLVMRAADLHRSKGHTAWVGLNGRNQAQVAFENSLEEVVYWASQESGISEPDAVLTFLDTYLDSFFEACPNWQVAAEEITEHLTRNVRVTHELVQDTLEGWENRKYQYL